MRSSYKFNYLYLERDLSAMLHNIRGTKRYSDILKKLFISHTWNRFIRINKLLYRLLWTAIDGIKKLI